MSPIREVVTPSMSTGLNDIFFKECNLLIFCLLSGLSGGGSELSGHVLLNDKIF